MIGKTMGMEAQHVAEKVVERSISIILIQEQYQYLQLVQQTEKKNIAALIQTVLIKKQKH